MLEAAVLTVLPGAVAFAAAMDLFTMKIPNRISVVLVLAFFPLALAGRARSLGHGSLTSAAGRPRARWSACALFIRGWFGGGDAKLMAAIALWVGFENLLSLLLLRRPRRRPDRRALLDRCARCRCRAACWDRPWALRLHRRDVRHSLWHGAGSRRPARLSADGLVRQPRRAEAAATQLTRSFTRRRSSRSRVPICIPD